MTPFGSRLGFALLASVSVLAPIGRTQVVDVPKGKVEFIGLEDWTIPKLEQALSEKAPGVGLDECARHLRALGFPDVAVQRVATADSSRHTIVTVVEPKYAHLIQFKPRRNEGPDLLTQWRQGRNLVQGHLREFEVALKSYGWSASGQAELASEYIRATKVDPALVEQMQEFLRSHKTPADHELAVWTLEHDPNAQSRTIAAAILTNFPESELAWWTLMDAVRDPVASVSTTAVNAMGAMVDAGQRTVNWLPAAHSIRDILNGTNVFLLHPVMEILVRTNVSPELAALLLRDGGRLVLANLRASRDHERDRAHSLLVQLKGTDLGADAAKWAEWIAELTSKQ